MKKNYSRMIFNISLSSNQVVIYCIWTLYDTAMKIWVLEALVAKNVLIQ